MSRRKKRKANKNNNPNKKLGIVWIKPTRNKEGKRVFFLYQQILYKATNGSTVDGHQMVSYAARSYTEACRMLLEYTRKNEYAPL